MKSVFCMAYFNLKIRVICGICENFFQKRKIRVICGICEGLQSSVRISFRKEKSVSSVESVRAFNLL
jgi:hypothetical protein